MWGWGGGAGRCCSVVGPARCVWGGGNDGPPGAAPGPTSLELAPGRRGTRARRGHAAGGGRVAHGWTRALGRSARTQVSALREQGAGSSLRPPAGNKKPLSPNK